MTTYMQAIADAAQVLADARAHRDSLTPEQAADEAYVPGGMPVEEIAALIRCHRAEARSRVAA